MPAGQQQNRDNEGVLLREDRDAVAILTLNRPEARNSLSAELMAAFQAQIDEIAESNTIKVAVITANGPAFSAGHDIRELESHRNDPDGGRQYYWDSFTRSTKLMQSIVRCPKPVIAAVTGAATAAGCQLVATCDLAVAGTDAEFCTPGVHIGLFCSTPMVALARNVGRKRAMEMLLLGEMVGAEKAHEFGLVNTVVPNDRTLDEAMRMAGQIASKSAPTVAIGKQAFYRQVEEPLGTAYETASRTMLDNMMFADAEEGLDAFLNKRPPEWKDS